MATLGADHAAAEEANHAEVMARYDDLVHELGRRVGWRLGAVEG